MFDDATVKAAAELAARLRVDPAALLAVAEVESGGQVFALVDGRNEPLIRFEGHYFDKRLSGPTRDAARKAGLAAPAAGAVKNPVSQAARWVLLKRAADIDRKAAYESVSWGLGQVMGAHWDWLDFASVEELVDLSRRDAAGQMDLMARFIYKAGLAEALRRRDFPAFARGYNGPAYAKNAYDRKMASAHARWSQKLSPAPSDTPMLKRGSTGDAVAKLQRRLAAAGHALGADGDFGPRTEAAVRAFQRGAGLMADGVVGAKTWAALG